MMKILLGTLFSYQVLAAPQIKVVTYNTMLVCVGPGCLLAEEPDLEARAKGIGVWLKDNDADIVFVQEAFQERHFDLIAEAGGYRHSWHVGGTGMGLLSKFPISKKSWTPFRWQGAYRKDCKRLFARLKLGLGTAEVRISGNENWRLAMTHLLPRYSEIPGFADPSDAHTLEREILALEIAKGLADIQTKEGRLPLILGGDFNLNQASTEYGFLKKTLGLEDALRVGFTGTEEAWTALCTYCGSNPHVVRQKNQDEKALDHIFLSPRNFSGLTAAVPTSNDHLSDHRPVVVAVQRSGEVEPFQPKYEKLEAQALLKYLDDVSVHPFCYFAPTSGWTQKSETKDFLKSLFL